LDATVVRAVQSSRTHRLIALAAGLLVIAGIYLRTVMSMVDKWNDDAAFSYGFVIAPISLWLIWQRREWLQRVPFESSWLGTAAAFAAALGWVVAKGTGVLVVEQAALVFMVQAFVLAVLGWPAARAMLFPLAFLVFLVPFGRAFVPYLVDFTADIATFLLELSGVPVYRTHTLITIPGGWFQVARACSGVSFLMTALVLGVLYAQLNFQDWRKRIVAVALACTVPVLANALRVYITIFVSHLTDMEFGPGAEHVTFGQVFFIAIMLATFWIGRRWHDTPPSIPRWVAEDRPSASRVYYSLVQWLAPAFAMLGAVSAPAYLSRSQRQLELSTADAQALIALPRGSGAWSGPREVAEAWRPRYTGGVVERLGSYESASGGIVDAFVAVYGLGFTAGTEMVGYENVLYADEKGEVADVEVRRIALGDVSLSVRELVVPDRGKDRLVWHWYLVGDRPLTSPYMVKALETLTWLTRRTQHERVVTIATSYDDTASTRLHNFVLAHANCVVGGFAAAACRQ
jgi:exosortase A